MRCRSGFGASCRSASRARAEHPLDRLLVLRVAGERPRDARQVQRERHARPRGTAGSEHPLERDGQPPARARSSARAATAPSRRAEPRARRAASNAAGPPCSTVSAAVTVTTRSVSTSAAVDAERDVALAADLDEVVGLASCTTTRPGSDGETRARTAARCSRGAVRREQPARDEDRHRRATPSRSSSSTAAVDRLVPGPVRAPRDRQRRLLDHDRRRPAARRECRERRAGQREAQRLPHRGRERRRAPRGVAGGRRMTSSSPGSATTTRESASRGMRVTSRGALRAAVTPRATKIPPDAQARARAARGLARSLPASRSASSAYAQSLSAAIVTNSSPRNATCRATGPRLGSTNCGRNARKNSAVFGLSTLTTTPWVNSRCSGAASDSTVGLGVARQDPPDPDEDQIGRADELHDREGGRRRGDERRQAGGRGRDVHESAARDAEGRDDARRGGPCRCSA